MWKWYVYIIHCLDNSYYTGMTWNPSQRWLQHQSGHGCRHTAEHEAMQLVYLEEFEDLNEARLREQQIKRWSRKKKEKLIRGEWGRWM